MDVSSRDGRGRNVLGESRKRWRELWESSLLRRSPWWPQEEPIREFMPGGRWFPVTFPGSGNLKGFGLPWMPVFPPPYGPSGLLRFLRILMPGTMLSGENMFTFSGLPGIRILTFRGIPGLSMVPGRMRRYVKAAPISKEPMISAPSAGPQIVRKIPCGLFTGSPIIERDLWGGFGFEGMPFSPIWCAL
jgi:hypothetical protein